MKIKIQNELPKDERIQKTLDCFDNKSIDLTTSDKAIELAEKFAEGIEKHKNEYIERLNLVIYE